MPRAKRSKQYRKLMEQFSIGFGFHVPYQVLVDADFLAESMRCKMDIVRRLEDTLHGQVKPLITQCSMRHLYARKSEPGVEQAIEKAKGQFERRRCGHHPEAYAEPLSAEACVRSVVDAQGRGVNKHRYVCAVNDEGLRAALRQVPGVPLVFIRRSVVLMEPMAHATARVRSADERRKFRAEIKMPGGKRKRDEEDDDDGDDDDGDGEEGGDGNSSKRADATTTPKPDEVKKKRKPRGPKEPNPLAVKKKKKKPTQPESRPKADNQKKEETAATAAAADQPKKKRRRKHKGGGGGGGGEEEAAPTRDGEGAPAPVTA